MGNRLHVAKKYEVDYANLEYFNWQIYELHDFLYCLGIDNSDMYDEEFEESKKKWKEGIEKLKTIDSLDEGEKEDILESLEPLGYSVEKMIEIMQKYLDASDPNNDYMHFLFY